MHLAPLLIVLALGAQAELPVTQDFHFAAITPAVKPWYKDWKVWTAIAGAAVLGAIIEHQWDDDDSGDTHNHKHFIIGPEPCHPPGHCR